VDVNHPRVYERNQAVFEVLRQLQSDSKPMISALNKIDLLEDKAWLKQLMSDFVNPVPLSAKRLENLGELLVKIQENFSGRMVDLQFRISLQRMDLVDLLYRQGKVKTIEYLQDGIKVRALLPKILSDKLLSSKEIEEIS